MVFNNEDEQITASNFQLSTKRHSDYPITICNFWIYANWRGVRAKRAWLLVAHIVNLHIIRYSDVPGVKKGNTLTQMVDETVKKLSE